MRIVKSFRVKYFMNRRLRTISGPIVGVYFGCFLSVGCSRQTNPNTSANVVVEKAPDPHEIEVQDPAQFPLVAVEQRRTYNELKVNGVVTPDVSRTVPVVSLSGGRVVDALVRLGDDVKKGQVVLRINSPDVAQAFSDYQKFKANEGLARRQLERSELLYSKGAIAQKDLDVAEEAEENAKVDLATALDRLRALGADADHPSPILDVHAPISGTVVAQNIAPGGGVKSLDATPDLFTIADLSRVWLLCDVYENDLSQVHLGDFADVRLNAYHDRVLRGRVNNISRVLDPTTRAAKVRLELENPGGLMRAGMFAVATFRSRSQQLRSFVPATAILRLHDRDWVFLAEGGKRFRRTEIQAGPVSIDSLQAVLGGLVPGDKVAANALQFATAAGVE